jgi:hypothetical protein
MHPPSFDDGRPSFDNEVANRLIGKLVLVGITYQSRLGEPVGMEQFFGTVSEVDSFRGIAVLLSGTHSGETKWFPPDPSAFHAAGKGQFRLRSTGEIVNDPDFTAQWTLTLPDA